MPGHDKHGVNRRTFIKTTAIGGGVAGLAGCVGEDEVPDDDGTDDTADDDPAPADDDEEEEAEAPAEATEMVMVTSDAATAAYAASQGIAAAVNENTDAVFVEAQPSEGTEANVGQLNRQEAHIGYIQNWTAEEIREGVEPFDDLDFQPSQVFHFYDLPWVFATANEDWTSIMDIEADSRVNPTPAGSGTAPALEHALGEHAGLEYERVSFGFGEMGGAMNEGRLDAGAVTYMNFVIEPGWLQEMKGTVDLRLLDVPDDVADAWADDPALLVQDVDLTQFDGYDYAPDAIPGLTYSYNFIVRDDFDYDAVYEFLSTMFAVRDELADYHAILGFFEDPDFWVQNMYEGIPFHPAAADFYEEQGLWRDEFERAD